MTQITEIDIPINTTIDRILHKIEGDQSGPVIVLFGGIHGNEKAGVKAIKSVLPQLNSSKIKGTVYGIAGNIAALKENKRFIIKDLNRQWTREKLKSLEKQIDYKNEDAEQKALYRLLLEILNNHTGPFYFIDLHTTSSKTIPFITINDALINRRFSNLFPVPKVLGIEEYLEGPLLSYINQLGYVSLGFESGQHDDELAVTNSIAFINLALVHTEILEAEVAENVSVYKELLSQSAENNTKTYEVTYRHKIEPNEDFRMCEGYKSFQDVDEGIVIAVSDGVSIALKETATLFMPLYQKAGEDGYYLIRPIPKLALKLSAILRKIKFDNMLVLFPGVSWYDKTKEILLVNTRTAKYMAKQLFHLLGYRSYQLDKNNIKFYNRERMSKKAMYKHLNWYKSSSF
ncbi:succinylglutamate desuccinylase/aspartoacylase family protein [Paucihalobacter ruber]|uniref:Succinylglutamate desuccinylase/aspartoacylase family protein n=1 Tax=Paucihalobacter ruber TaxID=2567861 RepID=A0A506PMR0_9FLAO|nr:succinylglutamate desuccinylase/aspartoacylase family protein [Paucihalobacter ruber]TPV34914.1 succinylglutamate desuccinylase/aspartoacylase family protein [Paucihalobacter ruber]